ncbi:hypothetical protein Tco_1191504 [Tanacetum coccineum]
MNTYLKNMGSFTYNQLKHKSLEEIQKLYEREQKWINDFVPMDSKVVKDSEKKDDSIQKQAESSKKRSRAEHDEESVKKQKLEDDTETEELRAFSINMLVEKKYPFTKEMLTRMLNSRLEADLESTMAFELIIFIKAQLEE